MKGMNVPPPSYGPAVWHQEQEPITPEGTPEEKLHQHLVATMTGDVRRSYDLFLGLAAEESMRPLLHPIAPLLNNPGLLVHARLWLLFRAPERPMPFA